MSLAGDELEEGNVGLPNDFAAERDVRLQQDILELKRQKVIVKSAFTKSKNALERLVSEVGLPSHNDILDAIDKVCDCESRAIDIVMRLSELYQQAGRTENVAKTSDELEMIELTGSEAQDRAQSFLRSLSASIPDTSSIYSSHRSKSSVQASKTQKFDQKPGSSRELQGTRAQTQMPHPTHSLTQVEQDDGQQTQPKVIDQNIRGNTDRPLSLSIEPDIQRHQSSSVYDLGNDMWKQLKRVSIPVFSGNTRNYESWKAAFKACIDKAPATPEYKLLQLRQYVRGDALKVIQDLGHSATAYTVALERLERKYGGHRRYVALQLEQVTSFKPIRHGYASDVTKFADLLDVTVVNLRDCDRIEELGNGSLYSQLLTKMTEPMVAQYQRWLFDSQMQESVETLREFVLQEAQYQTIASEAVHGVSKCNKSDKGKKQGVFFGVSQSSDDYCPICKMSGHSIWKCRHFKEMSVEDRWNNAKDLKLCFRCLKTGHSSKYCSRRAKCGIGNCTKLHSRFLHHNVQMQTPISVESQSANQGTSQTSQDGIGSNDGTTLSSCSSSFPTISLRTVPVVVKNGNVEIVVNALLDDASTQTYINEDVALQLGISGQLQSMSVNVIDGHKKTLQSMEVKFELESLDKSVAMTMSAMTTRHVTGKLKAIDWQKNAFKYKHLQRIPFPKVKSPHTVDLLIGLDHFELHRSYEEVVGNEGEPMARLTPLGWTCVGSISTHSNASSLMTYFTDSRDQQLAQMLHKFWEVDKFPSVPHPLTKDDKSIIESVRQTVEHHDDRYHIGIPWKANPSSLPDNYEVAYQRLCCTQKKLAKDSAVAVMYDKIIDDYEKKGYIEPVGLDDKHRSWYLPHFPVIRPERTTTKVRIVFDASSKCQGVSLNDMIHQGPKLQGDLFHILLRFRKNQVALVCDISEMYLQIGIQPNYQKYFRFLWQKAKESDEIQIYEFKRVVFGMNASPFLAQYISQENARTFEHLYPRAAETVLKSTYMDDGLDSVCETADEVDLYEQLTSLWAKAGMKARKWLSNSPEVLEAIPVEARASEVDITKDELPSVQTLGLKWISSDDEFGFKCTKIKSNLVQTKRGFLKETAKIFDPLGFLAPFHIRARMTLQKMWLAGVDWDDELNSSLETEAVEWLKEVPLLSTVRFPRCIRLNSEIENTQLHVFVDASQDAYGAVVYDVKSYKSGKTSSCLVAAKSRVTPLKSISIPRLELMAAVLGVKLMLSILHALEIDTPVALWTDSMNVIFWIKNHSRNFKTFVANRVGFIQDNTEPFQWRHVPSKLNAADILTRGTVVHQLMTDDWQCGPPILKLGENDWPKQTKPLGELDQSESKKTGNEFNFLTHTENVVTPSRYSDLGKLFRVMGWVLRFIHNSSQSQKTFGSLTADELDDAEKYVLRETQKDVFHKEIFAMKKQKPISSDSKLQSLSPFLDDDGIIRSSGRLKYAEYLPYNVRFPIILPRRHWVTSLVVKKFHEDGHHVAGTNQVLAMISSRFWIIAAREAIRDWAMQCAWCRKKKSKPFKQIMAPLPKCRLQYSLRAFQFVGVDLAGLFLTIHGRGKQRQKRYLCLFTCLATRAVHLEIAFGLDTDSFLNAFFRMTNRRGLPKEVISDNGTNFVGAVKELKQLVAKLEKGKLEANLANQGIIWKFNPPQAPHFGGVFEAMIKAAKRAIYAILGSSDVTDEDLMTAFTGAEALMNSRPLTYQSAHPGDDVPLTPNHFLHGQIGGSFAPESVDDTTFDPRRRWRRIQELVRHFWRRWMKEWLPSLQARKKWFTPSRDLRVDDVVVVVSPDLPRGKWMLGRIVRTYPGRDDHVRVVDIKTSRGLLQRPVTKVCPLEWTCDAASFGGGQGSIGPKDIDGPGQDSDGQGQVSDGPGQDSDGPGQDRDGPGQNVIGPEDV